MDRVSIDEFRKLPYVQDLPTDKRIMSLRPYFDHETRAWILYIPDARGTLGRVAGGEPVVGTYFAQQPAVPTRDWHFPLGTFIVQCASYEGVVGALASLESDIGGIACSLRKYDLITTHCRSERMSVALLLSSELAHLIIQVRSLYDVLQKVSKNLTRYAKAPYASGKRVINDLEDRFSKMALKGDKLRSREDIELSYRLPPSLADFYASEATRFKHLREVRVGLEHYGRDLPTIFCIESGAAVPFTEPAWAQFGPWDNAHIRQDHFGSLHWLFATIAADAIDLTTRYLRAFSAQIAVQRPLSQGTQLYFRHPFSAHLIDLPRVRAAPWEWESTSG